MGERMMRFICKVSGNFSMYKSSRSLFPFGFFYPFDRYFLEMVVSSNWDKRYMFFVPFHSHSVPQIPRSPSIEYGDFVDGKTIRGDNSLYLENRNDILFTVDKRKSCVRELVQKLPIAKSWHIFMSPIVNIASNFGGSYKTMREDGVVEQQRYEYAQATVKVEIFRYPWSLLFFEGFRPFIITSLSFISFAVPISDPDSLQGRLSINLSLILSSSLAFLKWERTYVTIMDVYLAFAYVFVCLV